MLKSMQLELDKHRMREVLDIFQNSIVPEVQKNGNYIIWDLVPIICQRLRGLNEFRFKTFNCCRQILIDLTDISNPKELLIIYLSELENDLNVARQLKESRLLSDDCIEAVDEDINGGDDEHGDFEITDSNCFKALVKPFELVLLRLPKKRNETLKSVLSSLNDHVSRLSLSVINNYDFNSNCRSDLSQDPAVKNLNSVLSIYVDFLETFVKEVDITNGDQNYQNYSKTSVPNIQRMILLKSLIRILDYPLKYMDLCNLKQQKHADKQQFLHSHKATNANKATNTTGKAATPSKATNAIKALNSISKAMNTLDGNHCTGVKPGLLDDDCVSSRSIAIKVMKLISCLHSSFYTLLNRTDLLTSEVIVSNTEFSDIYLSSDNFCSAMSVMCYLLATEEDFSPCNFQPRVYTHIYNLSVHMSYLRHLLESNKYLVYDKGLELLSALLVPIKEGTLEVKFLDLLRQMPIDKSLISIMIFAECKSHRIQALKLYKSIVLCLEPVGRYKMLYSVLSQPRQHSGLQAEALGMYKDNLLKSPIFQGTNLHRVVRSIISICLPESFSSDLLDKNDLIFAVISFFRYCIISDPKAKNASRFWDILPVVMETFLNPLHKAVELSRAHYKLELIKLKDMIIKKSAKERKAKEKCISLSVLENNVAKPMPEMTMEQEHNVTILALQNMDLLDSVICRLNELIDLGLTPP